MQYKRTLILSLLLLGLLFSCKSPLLPTPVPGNSELPEVDVSSSAKWLPPDGLIASHGQKRQIALSWNSVKKATRYFIFKADNPFAEYSQIAETQDATAKITLKVSPGASFWYKVCAVDSSGQTTNMSTAVHGTSLAIPVISEIAGVDGLEDTSAVVYWYMNNAEDSTYKKYVRYQVVCLDPTGKEIDVVTVDGSCEENLATFNNLAPNTNYNFAVEACLINAQNDIEKSIIVDAETARRLRPEAVTSLSATMGTLKTSIELSFCLPEIVDVALGDKKFEQHNLYFKIFRKIKSNTEYEEICSYFGANLEKAGDPSCCFDVYEQDKTVTWTDNSVERGIQYTYKVQSFADDISRVISSQASCSETTGWAMAVPSFSIKDFSLIKSDDQSQYISANLGLKFEWNNFLTENNYSFILEEKKYKLECDNGDVKDEIGEEPKFVKFADISSVNNYSRTFSALASTDTDRGYYNYFLYIVAKSDEDIPTLISNSVLKLQVPGQLLVTNDVSSPEIIDFSITSGFTNKILVNWRYDKTCKYSLDKTDAENNSVTLSEQELGITENTSDGEIFTYTDNVQSGDSFNYTLKALRGVSDTKTGSGNTLGTPVPICIAPSFDSISVKWKAVQEADKYKVSYSYDNAPETVLSETELVLGADDFSPDVENNLFYTFTNPDGWNDLLVSGKPVTVKITALSNFTHNGTEYTDSSVGTVASKTLGTQGLDIEASQAAKNDSITVKWNPISNAKAYSVIRLAYNIEEDNSQTLVSADKYTVDANTLAVTVDNGTSKASAKLVNNKIELSDEYGEATDSTSSYEKAQAQIPWGNPYHYIVLPVIDSSDFVLNVDNETDSVAINYKETQLLNISDASVCKIGSTRGYGNNVKASKADSTNKITISWTPPALVLSPPTIYRRLCGNSAWTKIEKLDSQNNFYEYNLSDQAERCSVYEYAINYYNDSFVDSYENNLGSSFEDNGEQKNIGYYFTLENDSLTADKKSATEESFTEKITWDFYNFDKRNNGPEYYCLYIKNANCSPEWFPIAKITPVIKNGEILSWSMDTASAKKDWYDVFITEIGNANGLEIRPLFVSDSDTASGEKLAENVSRLTRASGVASVSTGTHDGLLKVQRDYKHYYKLEAVRTNSNGESIITSIGSDESIYTWRKITDDEFVKMVTLIVSDAVHQIGGSAGSLTGDSGSFSIRLPYNLAVYYDFIYNITENYKHTFLSAPGKESSLLSPLQLSMAAESSSGYAYSSCYYSFNWGTIKVLHEKSLPSYQGTVVLFAGQQKKSKKHNLSLQYSRKTTDISDSDKIVITNRSDTTYNTSYDQYYTVEDNQTEFEKWFPFYLGNEVKKDAYTTGYNNLYPLCNNAWWNVRN